MWVQFFESHTRVARSRSASELSLIAQALSAALADASLLSTAPESFGTRMRLINLAYTYLHLAHAPHLLTAGTLSQFVKSVACDVSDVLHTRVAVCRELVDAGVCHEDGMAVETSRWPFTSASSSARAAVSPSSAPRTFGGGLAGLSSFPSAGSLTSRGGFDAVAGDTYSARYAVPLYGTTDHSISSASGTLKADRGDSGSENTARLACDCASGRSGLTSDVLGDTWIALSIGSLASFRERILRAALSWFTLPAVYYEAVTSAERVREDFEFVTGARVFACRA